MLHLCWISQDRLTSPVTLVSGSACVGRYTPCATPTIQHIITDVVSAIRTTGCAGPLLPQALRLHNIGWIAHTIAVEKETDKIFFFFFFVGHECVVRTLWTAFPRENQTTQTKNSRT